MYERVIKCTNADNVEMQLGNTTSPWFIQEVAGLYTVRNNVNVEDNSMTDGASYIGSNTQKRNIMLYLAEYEGDHMANRDQLYRVFKTKTKGTFTYYEGSTTKIINYYVESLECTSMAPFKATISLICPDPFFVDPYNTSVVMSGWVPKWTFIHHFKEGGEIMGDLLVEKLKDIDNESGMDNIGLTIELNASDTCVNPRVLKFQSGEYIQIGTTDNPFTLQPLDKLTITTSQGDKNVRLTRDGVTTKVNQYLDEGSTYLMLSNGLNTFRYSAASGEDYLTVTIIFRNRYAGV